MTTMRLQHAATPKRMIYQYHYYALLVATSKIHQILGNQPNLVPIGVVAVTSNRLVTSCDLSCRKESNDEPQSFYDMAVGLPIVRVWKGSKSVCGEGFWINYRSCLHHPSLCRNLSRLLLSTTSTTRSWFGLVF